MKSNDLAVRISCYLRSKLTAGVVAVAMIAMLPTTSSADVIFDVDTLVGVGSIQGSVTGTITTDGHTGDLLAADITSWDLILSISDGSFASELTNQNSTLLFVLGGASGRSSGLSATPTSLQFNFSITGVQFGFLNNKQAFPYDLWCFSGSGRTGNCLVGSSSEALRISGVVFSDGFSNRPIQNPVVIAYAYSEAPEPTTLSLLGLVGLVALALRKRRRLVSQLA